MTARQYRAWWAWRKEGTRQEWCFALVAARTLNAGGIQASIESQFYAIFPKPRPKLTRQQMREQQVYEALSRVGSGVRVRTRSGEMLSSEEYTRKLAERN